MSGKDAQLSIRELAHRHVVCFVRNNALETFSSQEKGRYYRRFSNSTILWAVT